MYLIYRKHLRERRIRDGTLLLMSRIEESDADRTPARRSRSAGPAERLRARAMEGVFLHFFINLALMSDTYEALEPHGLTRLHNRIMCITGFAPGLTMGELKRVLRVSHQNLNAPVRQLLEKGLLVAEVGTKDRRQKHLHLTKSGRQLVRAVVARLLARVETAYKACSPQAVETFLGVQRRILEDQDRDLVERMAEDPNGLCD